MNADFISSSIAIGILLPEVGGGGAAPSALIFESSRACSALGQCSGEIHRARSRSCRIRRDDRNGGRQPAAAAVGGRQREDLGGPSVRDGRVESVLRAA